MLRARSGREVQQSDASDVAEKSAEMNPLSCVPEAGLDDSIQGNADVLTQGDIGQEGGSRRSEDHRAR